MINIWRWRFAIWSSTRTSVLHMLNVFAYMYINMCNQIIRAHTLTHHVWCLFKPKWLHLRARSRGAHLYECGSAQFIDSKILNGRLSCSAKHKSVSLTRASVYMQKKHANRPKMIYEALQAMLSLTWAPFLHMTISMSSLQCRVFQYIHFSNSLNSLSKTKTKLNRAVELIYRSLRAYFSPSRETYKARVYAPMMRFFYMYVQAVYICV